MTRRDRVGIVGAGTFGTALANRICGPERPVLLWSQTKAVVDEINQNHTNDERLSDVALSEHVVATADPEELGRQCRFIVFAVNSEEVRGRARTVGDVTDGSHILVHAIGALTDPDEIPVSEVLREEAPTLRVGALAGPALPADLVAGRVSSMVCASRFSEVRDEGRRLLSALPSLRLYTSDDLVGVELASALAGAYTVALGLADGLKVGWGTRAVLLTRAVAEASRLGCRLGGQARTFSGLAGLGNILVRATEATATPDYRLGLALAEGDRERDVGRCEGPRAVHAACRLARRLGEHAPVLSGLSAVLDGTLGPAEAASQIAESAARAE
jgi:glycerol-3-phosphate dehydrogenase (NAD(P)+)